MDSTNAEREPDEGRWRRRGRKVSPQSQSHESRPLPNILSRGRVRSPGRGGDHGRSLSLRRQTTKVEEAGTGDALPASQEFIFRGGRRQAFAGTDKDFRCGSSSSLVVDSFHHPRERERGQRGGWPGGGRGGGWRGLNESGLGRSTATNVNQPNVLTPSHSVERQPLPTGSKFSESRITGRDKKSLSEHRGQAQHRRTRKKETWPISSFRLQELLQREPNNILLSTAASQSGVLVILDQATIKEDMVVLLIHALSKASQSTHSPQNLLSLLTCLIQSQFFLGPVTHFLMTLCTSQKPFGDICIVLSELILLCSKLLHLLPSSSVERVAILLVYFKEILNKHGSSMVSLKEEVDKLEKQKDDVMKQFQCRELMRNQRDREKCNDETPPDDFRQITIIPTSQDIKNKGKPFIRKNIVFGSYQSVDHYLDVQFRLLREDFVSPLRDGISEMLANENHGNFQHKIQDIKVYDHVHIQEPICTKTGIAHVVSFDASKLHRINWESSKRLIHGSLLCFSTDNFKTILFGTVAERDTQQLQKGIISVQMEDLNMQLTNVTPFDEFKMIESVAYFEAYRHNLEGLQEIHEDTLPFKKYILNNDAKTVDSPCYLHGRGITYNFQCLLPTPSKPLEVKVMDRQAWPSAEVLQLDHSQFKALQNAITKEFCVIQGPPGTGKTFIGLKIVQLLFANKTVWNQDQKPILVVCYTNHALDQFLEGILSFHGRKGLCRIGGGGNSENENLQACRLSNLKRDLRNSVPGNIRSACYVVRKEMETMEKQIQGQADVIRKARSSIIHEMFIQHLMSPDQRQTLMNCREVDPSQSVMLHWLWPKGKLSVIGERIGQQDIEGKETLETDKDTMEKVENEVNQNSNQLQVHQTIPEEDEHESVKEIYKKRQNPSSNYSHENQFVLTLEQLEEKVQCQEDSSEENKLFRKGHNQGMDLEDTKWKKEKYWWKREKQHLKKNLQNLYVMPEEEAKNVTDVWSISEDQRWQLYRYWVSQYCMELLMRMHYLKQKFSQKARQLNELRMEEDYLLIKDCTVIGMTTTGAAKYRQVIQRVQPRIVIVEEAAEVFESHIVTTLSIACEHLILIGDHQQLRPNPTMYKLAKDYHLDISLFERMVKNGMDCDCLGIQHRMRPEISSLIVPHVYSELEDHESVFNYENIKGLKGNIFFIDHSFQEDHVEDSKSRSNLHEAEYLAALCKYILQQEYNPCQITVLTTYTGQMLLLRKMMPKHEYEGVKITPVDNYQGEENDIILLSLVRSNEESRIGFLSVSNRVCVALSRAKKGFFAIGNMELLAKSSNLWHGIIKQLKEEGKVVEALPLTCQNHPEIILEAKDADDFRKGPEGGCSQPCEYRLACGHACILKCHSYDPNHEKYKCKKPCTKILCAEGHGCPHECFAKCGKCCEPVEKIIPTCGHLQKMECHQDPVSFSCCSACEKVLHCGHTCQNKCGKPCETQCNIIVDEREWPCGHKLSTNCHRNPTNYKCPIVVIHHRPCGHELTTQCHMSPDDFEKCCEPVEKIMPTCGHIQTMECHQDPVSFLCCSACKKVLHCGHSCQNKCGEPCETQCNIIVVEREWPCGHKLSTNCHRNPSNYKCHKEVTHQLPCGHQLTTQCHISPDDYECHEKVICQLVCGHTAVFECMFSSNQHNHRCREKVLIELPCGHFKNISCHKKMEKTVCNKSIKVQCPHKPEHVYSAKCEEQKIAQCPFRCCNILPCGHDCLGKCGDCQGVHHPPCQSLCRRVHPCGHLCGYQCGKPCPPCRYPYGTFCDHSFCTMQCGMQYPSCKKPCSWICRHYQCSRPCEELCDRPPCNAPCPNVLSCRHFCTGLCGEICPPVCRICSPWYIHQIGSFLGIPLTAHSRFLLLQPCGHVIEVTFMDDWMEKQDQNFSRDLRYYGCPICKQRISFLPRYGNQIKQREKEMTTAKQAIYAQSHAAKYNDNFRWNHLNHLTPFQQRFQSYFYKSSHEWSHLALACVKLFQGAVAEAKTAGLEDSMYLIWMTQADEMLSDIHPGDKDIEFKLQTTLDQLKILYIKVQVLKIKRKYTVSHRTFSGLRDAVDSAMVILNEIDCMKERVDSVIKETYDIISDKFQPSFCYRDDFLEQLNQLIPKKSDLILDRRWMVCEHGHVFCIDHKERDAVACPDCKQITAALLDSDDTSD